MGVELFNLEFKINSPMDLDKFFYQEKTLSNLIKEKFNRISHFFSTGVWINKNRLYKWIHEHKDVRINNLFDQHIRMKNKVTRCQQNLPLKKKTGFQEFKEGCQFFLNFLKSPIQLGTPFPSLNPLAKNIIKHISKNNGKDQAPRFILEIGPGTGIFTDRIIRRMTEKDELHLVEHNRDFCEKLQERYRRFKNVKVIHKSILDFTPPEGVKYNAVISGLPLNGFQKDFVEATFKKFKEVTQPGGTLSYFDYMFFAGIKKAFMKKSGRENLEEILQMKEKFYQENALSVDKVLRNIPPARVMHHKIL